MKKKSEPLMKIRQMAPDEVLSTPITMDELRNPHSNQPVKNPLPIRGPETMESGDDESGESE